MCNLALAKSATLVSGSELKLELELAAQLPRYQQRHVGAGRIVWLRHLRPEQWCHLGFLVVVAALVPVSSRPKLA